MKLETQENAARREMRKRNGANHRRAVQKTIISPDNPDYGKECRIVTETDDRVEKPLTLIVRLRICNSDERRAFRRRIAKLGVQERAVQFMTDFAGNKIPIALEITGRSASVWSATTDAEVISYHYPLDVPTFIQGNGDVRLDNCSASARRTMARRTMRKQEREARYSRENRAEYAKTLRAADEFLESR